jgi:hypothetical protein
MSNYEKNSYSVDREEKQKKASGLKTIQSNEATRSRLQSFLNTDTNISVENQYAKEEKKKTLTWIEDNNGKMIQVDLKKWKKKNKK